MIETLRLHTTIINDFSEMYKKILPVLIKQNNAGYTSERKYTQSLYSEVFNELLECVVVLNHYKAFVNFTFTCCGIRNSIQTICQLFPEYGGMHYNFNSISSYNGDSLYRNYKSSNNLSLLLDDNDNNRKYINYEDDYYDDDLLEILEFQLLTQYDLSITRAILLNKVLLNTEGYNSISVRIRPFESIDTEKENELIRIYKDTVIGLKHEIDSIS